MHSYIKNYIRSKLFRNWNIGFGHLGNDLNIQQIIWLKHDYIDRWFADPFILEETEKDFTILVEEFLYNNNKGRLARLRVNKFNGLLLSNEVVLDLNTHLSFPIPLIINNQIFLYPENIESHKTNVYRYEEKLSFRNEILPFGVADPVIVKHDANYYLLATEGPHYSGNTLSVYKSKSPFVGYVKSQEIQFKENIARRAGQIFSYNGMLISPAQVCNKEYGEAVSLQELVFEENLIKLREIKRINPISKKYPDGLHTFNVFKDHVIFDGYKIGNKYIRKMILKFI